MKNIFTICLIIICSFSLTNPLFAAGSKNKFALSVGRSISSPQGDFAGTGENTGLAKTGFGLSGSLEYLISEHFSIGGAVSYHLFKTKTGDKETEFENQLNAIAAQYQIADPDLRISIGDENKINTFGLYLKYQLLNSPKSSPYAKIGFGAGKHERNINLFGYVETHPNITFELPRINKSESVNAAGNILYMEGGGGYLYKLSETFGLKGEILYTRLMTNDKDGDFVTSETIDDVEERESITDKYKYNCDYISAFISLNFFFGAPKSK